MRQGGWYHRPAGRRENIGLVERVISVQVIEWGAIPWRMLF